MPIGSAPFSALPSRECPFLRAAFSGAPFSGFGAVGDLPFVGVRDHTGRPNRQSDGDGPRARRLEVTVVWRVHRGGERAA